MVLQIPCTKFSARILAAEHGSGPVPLTKHHPLFWKLRPPARGLTLRPPLLPLDALLEVECSAKLAKQFTRCPSDAGVALYRYHVEDLLRFTWARSLAGVPPLTSIKLYYDIYGILETDLDVMSAHKAWQRWKKKHGKFTIKHRNFYPLVVPRRSEACEFEFPQPIGQVEAKIDEVKNALYERRPKTPAYLYRQISIWFHFRKAQLDMPSIAKKHGLGLSAAYHAVQKIDGYLGYDEELAQLMGTNPAPAAGATFAM